MTLICDSQIALTIKINSQYIEIVCYFIREKIVSGDIKTDVC